MNARIETTATPWDSEMIRIAIIDDHPIARQGLERILSEAGGLAIVASAATASELAEHLAASVGSDDVDILIIDLYHDGDAPCIQAIAHFAKATRVLVLSASGRPADVLESVKAGASGYVTKQASPEILVSAIETVAAGGFYLSSQLADILHAELGKPKASTEESQRSRARPGSSVLSPREEEALSLIARGFTHAQAAARMGVGKATVDTYVERIRTKLQVGNKAELANAAFTYLRTEREPL